MKSLRRAEAKSDAVTRFVESLKVNSKVVNALTAVTTADLADPATNHALQNFTPLLEPRLRVIEFETTEDLEDGAFDEHDHLSVTLDNAGRRVRDLLQLLTGNSDTALLAPGHAVVQAIYTRLRDEITAHVGTDADGEPEVSWPTGRSTLEITALRYSINDELFSMTGTFDVTWTDLRWPH